MYPKGVIYDSSKGLTSGILALHASLRVRATYGVLRGVFAGIITSVLILVGFAYGPLFKAEIEYATKSTSSYPSYLDTVALETSAVQAEARAFGVDSYFSLVIPKIEAASNIEANVDTANKEEYMEALGIGVAHAKGTYFPGQGRNIYVFSHSTDSPFNMTTLNAEFYLLRKLEAGDRVIVYFADKKYVYVVEDKVIAEPEDTHYLTDDYGGEVLLLQTCDPPGTTLKRLIVVARPI